jgi:NAD(P)-dependent dehydrogenase (short-subunit alcohol dehydrogenase family)
MTLLVTGGAAGIGLAVVNIARGRGEKVVVLDRSTGVDASDSAAVEEFVSSTGPFTRLAHIAGVVGSGRLSETSDEEWDRVLRNNLTSAFVVARSVIPRMAQAGGGAVVLMSSLNARDGGTRLSGAAYASAKAGVLGLMRHLAVDYGPENVRVNGIAPGPVKTAMHDRLSQSQKDWLKSRMPLARVATPEEIAEIILFLLSPACASVTGMTFDVNGGSYVT